MESTMKIPKLELPEPRNPNPKPTHNPNPNDMIVLSSSSDSDSDDDDVSGKRKKRKLTSDMILPLGFLDPLPSKERPSLALTEVTPLPELESEKSCVLKSCKQFWKAGDFEVAPSSRHWDSSLGGMDHVRVHPKFLHSNATSHKWVLGAFAELLDNSLDELCNGATYANIDMVINKKDGSRMLLIDDDGGGMSPDKMRQCMSLGYSAKSKMADTIGQYGNGFKTSTMRLGADVIVFSRSPGINGDGPTQTIGLLSYTFLMSTGKEDIVVPMLDYEKRGQEWSKIVRSCIEDWNKNVETVVQWSPFVNEADLLRQFNQMKEHGTRIFIYNLWEDDQGQLELDFDTDPHDIQIRGVNRDDKNIQMAQQYPNSRHFLTYRHSLRSYASILYLRVPPNFRVILRGRDVEHHNIVNDMMMTQEVTYRPQPGADGIPKDANMVVSVTIGFVKDAKAHIDVSGFNVYHKNRLIKPFWKLWHPPGSDGRGVIGVLEANFVEPAHDKQGFERTIVLSRLEARLIQMQKTYWTNLCHKIGYAPRTKKSKQERGERGAERETYSDSPISNLKSGGAASNMSPPPVSSSSQREGLERRAKSMVKRNGGYARIFDKMDGKYRSFRQDEGPSEEYQSDDDIQITSVKKHSTNGHSSKVGGLNGKNGHSGFRNHSSSRSNGSKSKYFQGGDDNESSPRSSEDSLSLRQLIEENRELKEKLKRKEEEILGDLLHDLQSEREKLKSLESQLEEATKKIESMNKEQDNLIDIFAEERQRRDLEEEALRKKLKDASETIQELVEKITTTN